MQSMRSVASVLVILVRRTGQGMRLSKTMRVISILAVIGAWTVLGQGSAVAAACFSGGNLLCGNGDPMQSLCDLSSPVTGTGTCRAYRTPVIGRCTQKFLRQEMAPAKTRLDRQRRPFSSLFKFESPAATMFSVSRRGADSAARSDRRG